jgi:hypothetical protein
MSRHLPSEWIHRAQVWESVCPEAISPAAVTRVVMLSTVRGRTVAWICDERAEYDECEKVRQRSSGSHPADCGRSAFSGPQLAP